MKKIHSTIILTIFFVSFFIDAFGQGVNLRLHFINVGEGDAMLIESSGGKICLIDTGNLITGFRLAEYLENYNIKDLEYLILTHPHTDHIGGVFLILPKFRVKKVYDNGQDLSELSKSIDMYRWYEALVRKRNNYGVLKKGDILSLGEVNLKIIWPRAGFYSPDFNNNSLVIMVEYERFRCLLSADITAEVENKLLEESLDLKADILKVAHHGADDATGKEFLNKVSPQIAIISVDAESIWEYPSAKIIERIKKSGTKLYRTDRDGDIILNVYKDKPIEIKLKEDNT